MAIKGHLVGIVIPTALTLILWSVHIYLRAFWSPGSPYRLLVTAMLVLSFAWVVFVHVLRLRHADEYYKQVHCRALAIAYPTALVLLFALGFFRAEGLFHGADSRDLVAVLLLTYALGLTAAFKHYE